MEQKFSYTRENSTSKIEQTIKGVRMPQMSFIVFLLPQSLILQILHR